MKRQTKKLLMYGGIAAAVAYFIESNKASATIAGAGTAVGAYQQRGSRHFMQVRGATRALRPS